MKEIREYIENLSNEELFNEYQNQYQEWEKTGVLNDGIIRTIETKLKKFDLGFNLQGAERLFIKECMKRFVVIMDKLIDL